MEFPTLAAVRVLTAAVNIIHDCDEVYNYWEPLHYLLHGYGMQTWEYSSKYALRSHVYVLLHGLIAYPATIIFGDGSRKFIAFLIVRMALALVCAFAEARFVRASKKFLGDEGSWALTLLLCFSSGTFFAASTLLPSTFMMYCMLFAATGVMNGNNKEVVVAACVGVTLGWPVAGIALLPYALYILLSPGLLTSFTWLFSVLGSLLLAILACDTYFYGRVTFSLWNFVKYNVVGGGDSALYGVEPAHFYLLNGFLNFNSSLLLALAFPLVVLLQASGLLSKGPQWRLCVAVSPLLVWLMAISALPHKEERFLYVVYPLIALSAAATLVELPRLLSDLGRYVIPVQTNGRDLLRSFGAAASTALLVQTLLTSASRSIAILAYYGAPMAVWTALTQFEAYCPSQASGHVLVCTAAEWYRFPSSFYLPSPQHRLAFVDSAFDGLLPKAFDKDKGGTRAAPAELNDRNKKHPSLVLPDASQCAFLVEFVGPGQDPMVLDDENDAWRLLYRAPFVDNSRSPFPWRAFWWPGSAARNAWGQYQLWRQDSLLAPCFQEDRRQIRQV